MKRETAFKTRIKDILEGKYVVNKGWEPNYVEINSRKFSRVNILGTYIGSDDGLQKIDDGTGIIMLRIFNSEIKFEYAIGDTLLIIGRPREFNGSRFIAPEIIKKIENNEWVKVRALELKNTKIPAPEVKKEQKKEDRTNQQIIELIKTLDSGEGVLTEAVVKKIPEAEKEISILLEHGEIFEIRPGVLKILS
jgi:hypothetical protein